MLLSFPLSSALLLLMMLVLFVVSVSRCCRVAEEGGGEEGGQGVGGKDRRLKMALGFTSSAVWNTERRYNYILWNYI